MRSYATSSWNWILYSRHMQHAYVAVKTPKKNQPRNVRVYLNSSAKEYLQTFQSKVNVGCEVPICPFHVGVLFLRVESCAANKQGHEAMT